MGNKSQIGGVLAIISGALGVLGGLGWYLFSPLLNTIIQQDPESYNITPDELSVLSGFFIFWGTLTLLLGVLAIIGGTFAVRRKVWGMALTGAIASIFTFLPLGIASVILVSMGKHEFASPVTPVPATTPQPPVQPPLIPPVPPAAV